MIEPSLGVVEQSMIAVPKEVLNITLVFGDVDVETFLAFVLNGFIYVGEEVLDTFGGGARKFVETKFVQLCNLGAGSI